MLLISNQNDLLHCWPNINLDFESIDWLQIYTFFITIIKIFSEEFNRAIEDKVRAEQEALKAKNEKLRRVTQAEAAAAEKTLAADAKAYEIKVESQARANAIQLEAKALKDNPQLIDLRIAEKWDGKLPKFSGGEAIPLLNIDNLDWSSPVQTKVQI